jgi:hypothetical protein
VPENKFDRIPLNTKNNFDAIFEEGNRSIDQTKKIQDTGQKTSVMWNFSGFGYRGTSYQ